MWYIFEKEIIQGPQKPVEVRKSAEGRVPVASQLAQPVQPSKTVRRQRNQRNQPNQCNQVVSSGHPLMYPSAYLRTCSSVRRQCNQRNQRNQRNHICSSPHLFTNLEKWEWVWNFYFLSKIQEDTSEIYSFIFDSLEKSFKISLSPHKRWEKKIPFSFSSWKLRILEGTWENISIFKGHEYETFTFYQKYRKKLQKTIHF